MSFSLSIKNEILENRSFRGRYKHAQAYGMFLYAKSFSQQRIHANIESEEVAKRFVWYARNLLGRDTPVVLEEIDRGAGQFYSFKLPQKQDRMRLLERFPRIMDKAQLSTTEHIYAFISGVFLACGNMMDPKKSYHLEFVVREESLAHQLVDLLDGCNPGAKITTRRRSYVVYYKECAQIQDLLIMIGASKACLSVIDIEMIKSVRNLANRVTNCETANIDKQVNAAAQQLADIQLLFDTVGKDTLPERLREVALLRMQNPDMSLRELAEISPTPISRSGMHHRLNRLSRMAQEIREGKQHV